MAKNKEKKAKLLNEYEKRISSSTAVIFAKQKGVTVNELNEFRKKVYSSGPKISTVKNTLLNRALNNLGIEASMDKGSYMAIFADNDVIEIAKEFKKFIKTVSDREKSELEISFSIYEQSVLNKEQTEELADMPDKKSSISMILGIIDQSIAGVLNVLEDPTRSYVTIIEQAFQE